MAAPTKAVVTATWASGSATTSGTTNPIDVSAVDEATISISIAVVGSPTAGASFQAQYSYDGTSYYTIRSATAPTAAGTYYWTIAMPLSAADVQVVYTAQTGGTSSTIAIQVGKFTE